MNGINKEKKSIVVKNNDSINITDINSKQLVDKRFEEIGSNEVKIRKSEDNLRKWKDKKIWELGEVLNEVWYWFLGEIARYNSYQKEGKFFDRLAHNEYRSYICNQKKLEVLNRINEIIDSRPYLIFQHNEKTRQLIIELAPLSECQCNSCRLDCIKFLNCPQKWCFDKVLYHIRYCLKTEKEIEEYSQKVIKNFKEALREIERTVLKEKGVVWDYKELEVDDYFWDRAIQNMYSLVKSLDKPIRYGDSKVGWFSNQSIKIGDELAKEWIEQKERSIEQIKKRSAKKLACKQEKQQKEKETSNSVVNNPKSELSENKNPSNQTNQSNGKNALITKLKAEIAELKKNLDPNNAKQKAFLAQKKAQLVELDKENQAQSLGYESKNSKGNNLISVLLPAGMIFAVLLVASSAVWIAKKRKNLRRIKVRR